MTAQTLTPCTFAFDDGSEYEGFTDGTTWNGWANVHVTPAVRDLIAADLEKEGADFAETVAELRALPEAEGLISLANGYSATITPNVEVERLVEWVADITSNAMALHVQNALGSQDGGPAGMFFAGEREDELREMIRALIRTEKAFLPSDDDA
jgi:hypothetical protein